MKYFILLSNVVNICLGVGKFQVAYQWKSLDFKSLEEQNGPFDPSHPVPFGIAKHGNRMFMGMARRNTGVPFTLGYINLDGPMQDQKITPYPNVHMNTVNVSCCFCTRPEARSRSFVLSVS